ncbi:MAG TPA: energy transducer TonB [Pyrinomonadaceae bacterium]|jgi:protein TonB|nr:energy transducer TonB [Pyrinomonadaceae bacterium]
MFTHLIESGSHKKDMARRGRFFLGTLGFYGLLLLVVGVASIYAYDTHLGKQNLELYSVTMLPLPPAESHTPDRPQPAPGGARRDEITQRASAIAPLLDNTRPPDTISTERNRSAEIPRHNAPYLITGTDVDPRNRGGSGVLNVPGGGDGNYSSDANRRAVVVPVAPADDPLPPTPTPTPAKRREQIRVSGAVINSKVISKPSPAYPMLAKQARVQGTVTVEIVIDEQGRVMSAQATSGHPLLRMAAQQSAYQARFSPTSISGQPVKVSGVITYNFILQ